ncbi:PREDICTED: ATP-dependent zinc metalloprotease YME1L1 [Myotis davidii]|uniref:ATP-dependent zinc metalloprotease YME1L1 n=3 Tax=Myotis TaxID=9434 RepID=L5LMD2_MYODS|nr:PREDICTED: ATP-dependent zinc metalloprotease YME1L1 [Myotis brandtii]XP_006100330.1 ATP-dependent zinc metalloprotease YME1L1 isoform X1 [Myotis lucifugus]XP_006767861.1 PREDICTED: ATP-dependent zinc metalloprotease YME1L1 [Myotis davidii]XP_036200702.1 ATP-dependent zinc metalloprotease YME1L1 isoform X2 [Myotis myotis]ELK27200.1 ATP-dependent zinc metalloprotease YME1L1 [Myotis davidii]EPQ01899.1 ATP-dependent zinc metalloprotease YME1L1 [Myotis brandtii]KAF6389487.1 YME1 like 1 ATPase 
MFSLSSTVQPQVTVPLSHLINAFHSPKSTSSSVSASVSQNQHRDVIPEHEAPSNEPVLNLRDLGLSELKIGQIDQLVDSLLPGICKGKNISSHWHTSHVSAQSFFENKYGYIDVFSTLRSSCLYRQHSRTLKSICSDLQYWPVFIQSRSFKTLKSRTRRLQSTSERLAETQYIAPSFVKGFLLRDRGSDVETLDKLMKTKNIPEAHQDAFKTGFAEGFLKAQALTQKTNDSLRRTRLILFVLLLLGIYGLLKNPFLSVRFRTTTGLDSAVDPVQMKNVTFEHVKGVEEAKQELQEVVEFLKNPQKFTVLGGKLPKGILLVGPPGTGKTLLARAVAGEADVPFYYASGSEFDEMFVGVGASRIRNLFREAKANAPCVIFIDELDSVGGKRIESPMHPYSRQTINQLLAEMDGFKPNEGVIIIGATNFPEALDNALIRPGRFDMQVTVPRPDVRGRTEILKWYLNKIKFDQSVDPEIIARGTVGFSGAELENLVNQAALKAAVDGKEMVTMKELEFSKDKILMGPERRSVEIDNKNKTITAYHESGHAIIAYYTKDAMPINKATIMPRGPTLGHVSLLPENDRWNETRAQLLAQMDVSMGGRVAEELIFGTDHITTGASSDFDNATKIAKWMVTKFGMSEKLGVMTYSDTGKLSPETQSAIEQEIRILLKDSYERAKHILKTHAKEHKNLAEALLTYETLDAKEIQIVLEGKKLELR